MEKLKKYIQELQKIRDELKLQLTDEVIFHEASSFLRGELASSNKAVRNYERKSQIMTKPTQKQIDFLNKHKVKIPSTRGEATELIKNYIDNQQAI
jgi:hypothetical protein